MENGELKIDWVPPQPRKGLAGEWDKFIGPGATAAELWLQLVAVAVAVTAVPLYAAWQELGWTPLQYVLAAVLALDLAGGVATNATNTAKRWYHRPGRGFWQHFAFVAVHLHPFLVAWHFRDSDWWFGFVVYGYLLLATVLILRARVYLQRPLALLLFVGGLAISLYGFSPMPGMEWFVPVFYLKLLVAHVLVEAPFAPVATAV